MSTLIMLTAGGTFGHLAPALSLADELTARGYIVRLITDDRGAKFKDKFGGYGYDVVKAKAIAGNPIKKLQGVCYLLFGAAQSLALLAKHKPAAIIGFGGYPSMPPLAAVIAKNTLGSKAGQIKMILHEQNGTAGLANKIMAPYADKIAYSTPALTGIKPAFNERTIFTGNPVATAIAKLGQTPYPAVEQGGALNILVMGGSLGAESLGRAIPAALAALAPKDQKRITITQHCKPDQMQAIRATYDDTAITANLVEYVHDVAAALENAHLFIGRSGAGTVTEMTAAGRPAIYVPYPHHADQQQKLNAEILSSKGGAWIAEEDVASDPDTALITAIKTQIGRMLDDPAILTNAAAITRAVAQEKGYPQAASNLADVIEGQIAHTLSP